MAAAQAQAAERGQIYREEYWQATVGNREKLPLEGQAKEMVEAARKASRIKNERDGRPKWRGEKTQEGWPTQRLIKWAGKVLTDFRRDMERVEWQGEGEREAEEAALGVSLAKWLGVDKPPEQRVSYKV